MNKKNIYLGENNLNINKPIINGRFVEINNEKFYKISNYNHMQDFFMTIVSNSDHWMFISSKGSLSAGRKDKENALFPYYSDDKINDYYNITGSKTIILFENKTKTFLWEPFSNELISKIYKIERNIYKSIYGNKIIFEEKNIDLKINFQYSWCNSEKYGFVKKSKITNLNKETVNIEVLDGIMNMLPNEVSYNFQNEYSNLLDAYKKNELLEETNLGVFTLSSIPV